MKHQILVKDLTSSFVKFFLMIFYSVISSKIKGELQNFALLPTFLPNFAMKNIQTIVVRTFSEKMKTDL